MHDPAMNDILNKFNAVGNKSASTSAPQQSRSSSAGDPAMHDILSKFAAVSGTQSALKTPGQHALSEGLGAEQKRVGQLPQDFKPSNVSVVKHGDPHPMKDKFVGEASNPVDTVTMDVPLMIRMFEYAREEAKSDMDLHDVAEKLIALGTGGSTLTMDNYEDIVSNVENGVEDHEMDEAVGDKLTDLEYGSSTSTQTPTVGGYHQRRDLETGSYTDYTDRGPISTQTTYDKSGQMTSQHAQARVGDQSMARSRFYPKKRVGEAGETMSDRMQKLSSWRNPDAEANFAKTHAKYGVDGADQSRRMHSSFFQNPSEFASPRQMAQTAMNMGMSPEQVDSALPKDFKFDPDDQGFNRDRSSGFKTHFDEADQDWKGPGRGSIEGAISAATQADQLEKQGSLSGGVSGETHRSTGANQEIASLRKLAGQQAPGYSSNELAKIGSDRLRSQEKNLFQGMYSEDYVGGKEAPADLVKTLSKSYRDFVKEVEATNAANPDRELRSKTEKPKKFGNILDEE